MIIEGQQFSVRQFVEWSAEELGFSLRFVGHGKDEHAVVDEVWGEHASGVKPGDVVVRIDARYFRPAEVETLLGDPTKAREKLGWAPLITAREMCAEMVAYDLDQAQRHALLKRHGYEVAVSSE